MLIQTEIPKAKTWGTNVSYFLTMFSKDQMQHNDLGGKEEKEMKRN